MLVFQKFYFHIYSCTFRCRITRTFKNESGSLYTRTEIVRKPLVVETYVKVRETKDEAFIRQFATLDDNVKEEMKKEKRRIQEQLRRIKRNQEKERQQQQQLEQQAAIAAAKLAKKNARASSKKKPDLNLKCGACGAKGHMRTNKACPKFIGSEFDIMGPVNVAMTEKDEEELDREALQLEEDEELVKADDTKISISSKLLKHTDEMRRRTMQLKVPKKVLKAHQLGGLASTSASGKKRRAGATEHCDYLTKSNYRATKRRRTDPLVSLASFLESLHVELRQMNEAFLFLQPVNTKKVPDYLEKIKTPMDLQTIREFIQNKKYQSREDFLQDISLIVDNSATYNGDDDIVTKNAEKLRERVIEKFQEHDEMLIGYEKEINPLLDDNAQKGFTYAIKKILEDNIKTMQESWPFLKPVSRKNVKNYYELIKTPMTLEMMEKKVDRHQYHSRQEFLADFALIYTNSSTYNGEDSEYTAKAKRIFDVATECLAQYDGQLSVFEDKIREVQQRMVEQAEMESLGASIGEESQPGFSMTTPLPKGKRKRGRPRKVPLTSEFVANSDDDDDDDKPKSKRKTKKSAEAMASEAAELAFQESGEGNLADDLNFTSDEDDDADDADWEAVGDDDNAGEVDDGLTVTIENVDQQNVVIEEGQIVDIGNLTFS